jgi:transcriptional regulator with XRE-family HTH domain
MSIVFQNPVIFGKMSSMNKEMAKQKLKEAFFKRMRVLDAELHRRVTETELAERMGCPQPLVSRWVSGKGLPSPQYIGKVAREIPEIYEIMEMLPTPGTSGVDLPQPDPHLQRIQAVWPSLKEERKIYHSNKIEKEARKAEG